jgi:hypothetical protein
MKVFSIKENFPAEAGHIITVVKANNKKEALTLYKEHSHRNCLPSWIDAEEITAKVTEVYRYDNPAYEG